MTSGDSNSIELVAQLSCRYFRPGGIVRGIIETSVKGHNVEIWDKFGYVVAQIHAHCSVDTNLLSLPIRLVSPKHQVQEAKIHNEKLNSLASVVESFSGEDGICIFQSEPTVIFDRDQENRQKEFALTLPNYLCPSFRGSSAQVIYILSLIIDMDSTKKIILNLPFDVLSNEYSFGSSPRDGNIPEINTDVSGSSFPLTHEIEKSRDRRMSVGVIPVGIRKGIEIPFVLRSSLMHGRVETEILQRSQTSTFSIGKDSNHLVRFLTTKQSYHPGDTVLGIFDFSRSTIPCYAVSAKLCIEEKLSSMSFDPSRVIHSKIIESYHEFTTDTRQTNVRFTIPMDALPSITTDLVCFRWIIHFEFSTVSTDSATQEKELLRWQMPITVKAPCLSSRDEFMNISRKFYSGFIRSAVI
jgi:hypothetical protein